jgi:cell division protein FtsB
MDARRTLIRIVLLALLLYAAGCLAGLGREVKAAQDTARALTAELASVERENRAMRRQLDGDRSTEDWEMLAWQRLGLVRPGEIVFLFPREEKQA